MKALLLSSLLVVGSFSTSAFAFEGRAFHITYPELISASSEVSTDVSTVDLTKSTSCGSKCSQYKEIALIAKSDAQDYLIGEQATESLVKTIDSLRATFSELETSSDEEIVHIIATLE